MTIILFATFQQISPIDNIKMNKTMTVTDIPISSPSQALGLFTGVQMGSLLRFQGCVGGFNHLAGVSFSKTPNLKESPAACCIPDFLLQSFCLCINKWSYKIKINWKADFRRITQLIDLSQEIGLTPDKMLYVDIWVKSFLL